MRKSSFIDFKAIKAAITMEQVLEHYSLMDRFKGSGDSLTGPCPIHKGENPTQFRVSISKNIWNCFSECKHGGNTLDFIAEMEKISIHAAALKAVEWFKLNVDAASEEENSSEEIPKKTNAPAKTQPEKAAQSESNVPNKPLKFKLDKLQPEHPYLVERGLTPETITNFGIGFCAKGLMADRIAIPIRNAEGDVVAYAGRWPGNPPEGTPKYKLPQGFRKSLELYNVDKAFKEAPDEPLVIVEGFFDCMRLWQLGYKKVVALMGSSLSEAQEELIRKHTDSQTHAVLMLDEDEAGKAAREEIAGRLAKFLFVKIHGFREEGRQPEHLNAEEAAEILGGIQ
jgi:DNA primase